ncbi:methionyl-tRNA formyltransferase [Corynebacterium gerontici]|uniref:Methionyl-tRNA formyltransferase n=1 Tax=Corynebacterium gerontici TaxID=2079234 RepID=A0A3G6J0L9_9CORY|nr:methionyl-tRNA formyltransferase [Corynebacterium gerontici]AZA11499.1 Methionyl-tRNA formyltransferase [Corynebacterium gerontici]
MRLVFAGTPEVAVPTLTALIESEHEVSAVITRPDARKGRGRNLHPSPVKALALEHGIEVLTPSTIRQGTEEGDALRARLEALEPDCIPVVAYGNLIGPELLDLPRHGWMNAHFSLLPRWRGASPVQAALMAGDTQTGVTVFRIEQGLDTGPILGTYAEAMPNDATTESLLDHLAIKAGDLLCEVLDGLERGFVVPQPQDGEPSYAGKITTEQAHVDFHQDAATIERLIRALMPQPGAWAMLDDQRLKFGPISILDAAALEQELAAGCILVEKKRVLVGTADGVVQLGNVQPPGKKYMPARDWARGQHDLESKMFQ